MTKLEYPIDATRPPTLSRFILNLLGWKIAAGIPDTPKYVVIAASHTSNWDFILGLLVIRALGIDWRFVGKKSLFRGPMGWAMKRLGGIPVDRRKKSNFVDLMITAFDERDELVLVIAPEGTRGKTEYWRTGFYHIANGAGVPIVLGFLDYARKIIGFGPTLIPSGDIHADMVTIKRFYEDKTPRFPDEMGEIRIRPSKAPEVAQEVADKTAAA